MAGKPTTSALSSSTPHPRKADDSNDHHHPDNAEPLHDRVQSTDQDDPEEEEEDTYGVLAIRAKRTAPNPDGPGTRVEFNVLWEDHTDTWEPLEHLESCMELVYELEATLAAEAATASAAAAASTTKRRPRKSVADAAATAAAAADDDDDSVSQRRTSPRSKSSTRRSSTSSESSTTSSKRSSASSSTTPRPRPRRTVLIDDDDDDDDDDDAMDVDSDPEATARPTRVLPARNRQPPKSFEPAAVATPKPRTTRASKPDDQVTIPATTTSSGRVVRKPATAPGAPKPSGGTTKRKPGKGKSKSTPRGRARADDDDASGDADTVSDHDSPDDDHASVLARIEHAFSLDPDARPLADQCAECKGPEVPSARGRRVADPLFPCDRCSCAFHARCLPLRAKQSEYPYWTEGGQSLVCPYCVEEISAKVKEAKHLGEAPENPLTTCGLACSYCPVVMQPPTPATPEGDEEVDVDVVKSSPSSDAPQAEAADPDTAPTTASTSTAEPPKPTPPAAAPTCAKPAPLLAVPAHMPAIDTTHFRCTYCHRPAHYACATRAMLATPDADLVDHTSESEALDVLVTENHCAVCRAVADAPEVQVVLTWRAVPETAPEFGAPLDVATDTGMRREYLVKFVNKSYRETMWVPARWLVAVAKSKWRAYVNMEKKADVAPGTPWPPAEHVVVDPLWRKPRKVLDVSGTGRDTAYLVQWHRQPPSESTWVPKGSDPELEAMPEFAKALTAYTRALKIDSAADRAKRRHGPDYRPDPRTWGDGLSSAPKEVVATGNTLMPHQLQGLNWLVGNWMGRWNCVLADEMGLGKTVQIVTFVQYLFVHHRRYPVLVVVPNSTLDNWERELNKWAPQLHVVATWGAAVDRDVIADKELFASVGTAKKPASLKCHVVLATYESVMAMDGLKRVHWDLLVVDEGHRLKNDESKLFKHLMEFTIDHKILLTGTPLQNNLRELFNLMSFLEVEGFEDPEALANEFDLDKKKVLGMTKEEEEALAHQASEKIRELHDMLRPHFLRRVKTDVVLDIPPKAEILVPVRMSPLQRQLIKDLYSKNFHLLKALGLTAARASNPSAMLNNSSGLGGSSLSNLLLQCRKVLSHPFLLDNVEDGLTQGMSPVEKQVHLIDSCGKLALLAKMLPKLQADGHKILIFVQFQWTIKILSDFLYNMQTIPIPAPHHPHTPSDGSNPEAPSLADKEDKPAMRPFKFYCLDGTTNRNERQMYIDEYNNDPEAFAFVLTTRAGGVGINLTSADTVVIYDVDWNPHQDLQAIARAHRIGQTKPVLAYKLMTLDSAEEKMVAVGRKKLVLDHVVVQRMGKDPSETVSESDLLDTLKFGASAVLDDDAAANTNWQYTEEEVGRLLDRGQATEPANADNMSRAESPAPGEGGSTPPLGSASASHGQQQQQQQQQGGGFGFSKVWMTRAPARAPAHALKSAEAGGDPSGAQSDGDGSAAPDSTSADASGSLANVDDLGLGEDEGVQWESILEKLKDTAPPLEEENPFELGRRKRKAVNYADNVQATTTSKKRKKTSAAAAGANGEKPPSGSESADDEFVPPPEMGRPMSSDDEEPGFDEAEVIDELARRKQLKRQRLAEAEAAVTGNNGGSKGKQKSKATGAGWSNGQPKYIMRPELDQAITINGQTMPVREALLSGVLGPDVARQMGLPILEPASASEGHSAGALQQVPPPPPPPPRKVQSVVTGPTAQHAFLNARATKCWLCIGTQYETNTYHVPTQCPAISDRAWVEQEVALHRSPTARKEVRMMMNANRGAFLEMVLDELVRVDRSRETGGPQSENVAPVLGPAVDGPSASRAEDRMDVDDPQLGA